MAENTNKERSQTGEWNSTVTDTEIRTAVETHSPAATSEVADEIGMTRQGADTRLRKLHESGTVAKKKIGASLVWFIANDASVTDTDTDTDSDEDNAMPTVDDGLNPNAAKTDVIQDE